MDVTCVPSAPKRLRFVFFFFQSLFFAFLIGVGVFICFFGCFIQCFFVFCLKVFLKKHTLYHLCLFSFFGVGFRRFGLNWCLFW